MASSEKYVNGRDKLIAKNPALFYSNRFKRVVYDFSKPWTMVSGISKDQFNLAKNDPQALATYFPYKEMSNKSKSKSGFDYLKGNVYLNYNDYAGFHLRCKESSGVQAYSDYTKGDFIAAVDFGLKWSQLDIDITNSSSGLYSYSDIHNDQRSLWIAPTDSACDRANFIFKDNCLCDSNGFSSPTVYVFNLNDVPDIHDDVFNNGIYTKSEAQGYKGEMFNFVYPKSFSELSSKSDDELTNMTLEDYTFTKGVVSIKFTDNANDSVNPKTPTVFIETVGDVYSKRAEMTAFNIHTGTGKMFTISVPEEYYINAIFFLGALGLGHGLLVNGKIVPNNLTPNGIVNDTSLPICPIEDTESIWKANSNNLTSVSFADIATSGGSHTISAIYVSYAKKGETLVPPNIFNIDTGKNSLKVVDLGLHAMWASCNLGATNEAECGSYFQWGTGHKGTNFDITESSWYNAVTGELVKINNVDIGETSYDAATQMLGNPWRIPNEASISELVNSCTWTETSNGYRVKGPNGNEIFLPFTGYHNGTNLENKDRLFYWSSSYDNQSSHANDHYAWMLTNSMENGKTKITVPSDYIIKGMCIRPIIYVNQMPDTPTVEDTSESVDLGLSVKWARHNIGATEKTDSGNHYAWGSIQTSDIYNQGSYEWYDASTSEYKIPATNIAGTKYDVATQTLGDKWRIPTEDEFNELINKCTWVATDGGFRVIGTNGNEIFLPFTGMCMGNEQVSSDMMYYWSCNYNTLPLHKEDHWAYYLTNYTSSGEVNPVVISSYVYNGMCIRPVMDDSFTPSNPTETKKAIDLGLSVKWANQNIKSSSDISKDAFFSWGNINEQLYYNRNSYPYLNKNIDNNGVLPLDKDVAVQRWGDKWRMPTITEWNELINQCTWSETTKNGVKGYNVTGNGNTIFLPLSGLINDDGKTFENEQGEYWTSECVVNNTNNYTDAYGATLTPNSNPHYFISGSNERYIGHTVRPVYDETLTPNNPNIPNIPDVPKDDIDTPVSSKALRFTDTNETGYSVDPNVILYAGGQEVIPQTMTQKDNTLFLGNYKENNRVFSQEDIDFIRSNSKAYFTMDISPAISKGEIGSLYMYDNQLKKSSYDIASFKGGEVYRFGLVFQNKRGEWSDIIYVGDEKNDLYPKDYGTYFRAPKAQITISPSAVARLYDMGYRKAKAVVVYPSMNNRLTVCQGVMCPTVYNINSRKNNAPYAMSSWFYREMHGQSINIVGTQNRHNYNIYNDINDYIPLKDRVLPSNNNFSVFKLGKGSISQFRAEISCADINNYYAYNSDDSQNMYVDWNTVTMNTPEVDFSIENSPNSIPTENLKLRIVGVIPLTSNANDIYVNTSTQPIKVASFTGLHNTNDNHNNIDYNAGTPRLTKFDWYDYDYHQDTNKERTDWDINKQHFETSEDYDLTRDQAFQQAFKQNIKGLKVYADHKVYPLFPWQGAKSLVGQCSVKEDNGMVYSALKKKVISNIRTSAFTYYFPEKSLSYGISNVGLYSGDIPLSKLSSDKNDVDHAGLFNYYGEVDTILSPKNYYQIYHGLLIDYDLNSYNQGALEEVSKILPIGKTNDPVRMKYKSSPHLACHLNYTKDGKQELLPKFKLRNFIFGDQADGDAVTKAGTFNGKYYIAGWSDRILDNTANRENMSNVTSLHQNTIDLSYPTLPLFSTMDYTAMGFMYIGEFYKDDPKDLSSIFGGTTPMAFEKNQWHTAGPTMLLKKGMGVTVNCLQGDTYYQRYDSLKTYPYTDEDPNQIVEILSFMCETRMNIDGRYDNNRGLSSNLYMNKVNFNLFNPAYTQQDNFFNYYFLDPERNNNDTYPNDFIWTKAKTMGEEIDTWSNISSSASYSLDGDRGSLNSIINYNDSLLTFQDTGVAKIMYNDRVQVAASDGIPIELANSQKVSGKQYLSNTIGCSNKKTIQITPNGVYFMDSNSKDLYTLGNGINSLTKAKGFNNYLYNKDISKFKTFYDKKLKDVYFIDDENCLDFNEQLNEFEGFYDYEGTDYMFNYNDSFISVRNNGIWKQYAGDYNMFYGTYKSFWLTLISNEGNVDKTFNTVEFEADSWDKDNNLMSDTFDHLSTWDEYQIGESNLRALNINNHYHFSNLKRKFRVWRANIPRELKLKNMSFVNALAKIQEGNINNTTGKVLNMTEGLNRIRNTWAYIRLKKNNENKNKTVLHSVKVSYLY